MPISVEDNRRATLARILLAVCLGGLSIISAGWIGLSLVHGAGLTHESGVMTGLAMHASAGRFYPPLMSPGGYGGTRYGPVLITTMAIMIRLGVTPVTAGLSLTVLASLGLWAAMFWMLRLCGVSRVAAAGLPLLLFCSTATREAMSSIRPDLAPAALNVCGLAIVYQAIASPSRKRFAGLLACASLLFSAAMLFKITALFGVTTAAVMLSLRRRPRPAIAMFVCCGVAVAGGILLFNAASGGRLLQNFAACANASGRPPVHVADWLDLLHQVLLINDAPGTLLTSLALLVYLASPTSVKLSVPGVYLIVTIALTLPMYFTPGLSTNHLLDAHVAAALVLGVALDRCQPKIHAQWLWTAATAVVVLIATITLCKRATLARALYPRSAAYRNAVYTASPDASRGVIFSDNAMVPVSVGQCPFLLDDFMFPAVRHTVPAAQDDLLRRLRARSFSAIVLRYDPDTGDRWWVFGSDFAPALHANYELVKRVTFWDHLWVYRPKAGK